MERIGARLIYFTGSKAHYKRAIFEREDGTFWVMWYKAKIEVKQVYNDKNATAGWRTVEAY